MSDEEVRRRSQTKRSDEEVRRKSQKRSDGEVRRRSQMKRSGEEVRRRSQMKRSGEEVRRRSQMKRSGEDEKKTLVDGTAQIGAKVCFKSAVSSNWCQSPFKVCRKFKSVPKSVSSLQ